MNKAFLCLLVSVFPAAMLLAQAQYRSNTFSSFAISLPPPPANTDKPFNLVSVVDKRSDTAKIGFGIDGSKHKVLLLNGGAVQSLQRYINDGYATNDPSKPNLLIVLRNLWLQQLKAGEINRAEDGTEKQNISQCIARFEIYLLKNETYSALVRIDTVLENTAYLKVCGSEMLANLLDYTAAKIVALDAGQITARKTKLRQEELMQRYAERMDAPRLKADSLKRGIYLTFTDFLQNRPQPYPFILDQDDGGDYLYLTEGGEQKLFTNFWGFCDGRLHFIKLGGNFFPLVRDGNSYSFLGCLQPIHGSAPRSRNRVARYALFGVFGELHRTRLENFLRPMQLDMETGKPF